MTFWFTGGSAVVDQVPYYFKRVIGETATVTIRHATVKVELARTQSARARGLSSRHNLEFDNGMLFIFPEPGMYPFTLEKTKIPLDIVWISDGKIVYLARNVQPGTPSVVPGVTSTMVLETNAGLTSMNGWQSGDLATIHFDKD